MNTESADLWARAEEALRTAHTVLACSPEAAASRSYYAVSALFAAEGRSFRRHTEVRACVHRELVHAGRWPTRLGAFHNDLMQLREVGDYGVARHVSQGDAVEAIRMAEMMVAAVRLALPN